MNMQTALKREESNKGAAGLDGMEVDELRDDLKEHWMEVREALESGTYLRSPVRRVEIPKPDGGARQMGIPTGLDRLIQQAIAQVLTPMFEVGCYTATGFDPDAVPIKPYSKPRHILRKATNGSWTSTSRNSSLGRTMTCSWQEWRAW